MRTFRFRRKRRGVASVLGILIMVGILITSILPTFIYVNEVNNYYDRTVVDLRIADEARDYNYPDLPLYLSASEQTSLRMDFSGINSEGSYIIEVTTMRGNKFSSATNPLTYTSGDWQTGSMDFNIQVLVQSSQGNDRYMIQIYGPENHFDFVDSATVQGQFFSVFSVPQAGLYNVTVQNIQGSSYYVPTNQTVILSWIYPTAFCQFDDT
jgi:hypothetical protein